MEPAILPDLDVADHVRKLNNIEPQKKVRTAHTTQINCIHTPLLNALLLYMY